MYEHRKKRPKRSASRFQGQLERLASMGFQDTQKNEMLLRNAGGVVENVLQLLIKRQQPKPGGVDGRAQANDCDVVTLSSSSAPAAVVVAHRPRKPAKVRQRVRFGPKAIFVKGIWLLDQELL